jgi:hypothetical protein
MHLVDLGNVKFAEGAPLQAPPGSNVLVDSSAGPLLVIAPREAFEDAALGAEIVGTDEGGNRYANTDWPLRLSFPVFVLNVLEYLAVEHRAAESASVAPGHPVTLRQNAGSDRLTVSTPEGKPIPLERGKLDAFRFSGTDELGVYTVTGGQDQQRFAVNLFDAAESDIRPLAQNAVKIGFIEVPGQSSLEPARVEAWTWLLLAALSVLLLEWYIYNRRVYL